MLKNGGRVNQNIKDCDATNSSGPHCFVVNSDTYRVHWDGYRTLKMLKNGGCVNQNIKDYDASNSSGPNCFVVNLDTNKYSLYLNLMNKTYYY